MTRYIIDPQRITDYDRTLEQLEYFLTFCIFVAGRNSDVMAKKVSDFYYPKPECLSPFDWVHALGSRVTTRLEDAKVGQYKRIGRALWECSQLYDLRTISVGELETVHGVGMKTARFFVLHTQRHANCFVLDTHIQEWMRRLGAEVPNNVYGNKKAYIETENKCRVLKTAIHPDLTVAEFDLKIWSLMRDKKSDEFAKYWEQAKQLQETNTTQPA